LISGYIDFIREMQLLEILLLRYINDADFKKHIDELELLSEGEVRIDRVYQPTETIPIDRLIRHFNYKWEIASLRLRVAHSALYDFFNSENLYRFDETPNSHEQVIQITKRRLLKTNFIEDICYITLQLIQNNFSPTVSSNIQRDHLEIAYHLLDQLGNQ